MTDANEGVAVLQQRLTNLQTEMQSAIDSIQADLAPDKLPLEELLVQPKRSEINISGVTLVWLPWIVKPDVTAQRAY